MTRSAARSAWLIPSALTAIAAVALLSACTSAETGDLSTRPSTTKTSSPESEASSPAPIEAVLVVASVDADGQHVTASGYLQGSVQESGTCVFTFSGNGSEFTVEHAASADRMTTSCGTVQAPIDRFQRGPWRVTVGMTIDGSTYTSEPTTVEVP